jgi:hypothetical protein
MARQGQSIFENRVEYPLPTRSGVRDYLFYLVGAGDGYGKGARYFFDKFYPRHTRHNAVSLEDLTTQLHAEVTERGVQQIREIVIVAHATSAGLMPPVVEGVTASQLAEFRHITALSLACLQRDLAAGKFASLRDRRKKVLAHLKEDSWVTIRACNFGKSNPGMYALYAFFGGRANVYAPMEYQFFGTHPVMDGMRLDTKLRVHEHLVKQRYLPKDTHAPHRRDAVVRAFVDPGQFSEPFVLATVGIETPDPAEAAPYVNLVDGLNARRATDPLRARFSEQGFVLTRYPKVQVIVKDAAWLIRDALAHEGSTFPVEYRLNEEVGHEGNRRIAKLTAEARLVKVHSASECFPLQLFFSEHENETWRGKLFTLAFHTEEADADPKHRQAFEAFQGLLSRGVFADTAGHDIRAEFKKEQDIDLTAQARIREVSRTGEAPRERITWAIDDVASYLVRLEHPDTANGIGAHTLTVYENRDRASVLRQQYELMARLGSDPDTPGTELPAYLDRFTIDELISLIDHLRRPFKPTHSFYIHHAQQALKRKKDFAQWFADHMPDPSRFVLPSDSPYTELSLAEHEDKRTVAYPFDFNGTWAEVKASAPTSTAFREDLYAEEDLAQKLKIPEEEIASRNAPPVLESDSPFTDIEELRGYDRPGKERLISTEKFVFDPPKEDDDIACEEFAQVIAKWKELQGLDAAEIERQLGLAKASDGRSYLEWVTYLWDLSFPVRAGLALNNMSLLKDGFLVNMVAKIPGVVTISAGGAVASSTVLALLRVWPTIGIPFRMWKEFLMEQQKTEMVWEMTGRITAIRQWLRQLELLTFSTVNDLPDRVTIDLDYQSAEPYFIGRYYQEQLDEYGRYHAFIYAPTRMKKGFDDGARMMHEAGNEILEKADEFIDRLVGELNLDSCRVKVLADADLLDHKKLKARIVRHMVRGLLDELPKV